MGCYIRLSWCISSTTYRLTPSPKTWAAPTWRMNSSSISKGHKSLNFVKSNPILDFMTKSSEAEISEIIEFVGHIWIKPSTCVCESIEDLRQIPMIKSYPRLNASI
ncbi:unnamed protein product [Blepharisma stoltei]|uniref:Uncharacterized protein n=1 Tax=Blepharisma stoltei TaxID=1481888 RepID=A0AAU9JTI6_9CILI|nr:unnamed protein product [Blepharisma stoltei]